ncbi:uncharacterized protein PAC_02722 [Phialocephala subalpina]|uniref:Uncharacterized protein n=1 Tax=Phialocephala subalpina TaxID=576137 RepID=A0A1L7WJ86_9HELO|nr:uncharacterized protein PAC_02722 [Phialocephala subalpina]
MPPGKRTRETYLEDADLKSSVPKGFGDRKSKKGSVHTYDSKPLADVPRSEDDPMITISHVNESDEISNVQISQALLFVNTAELKVPQILDFQKGDESPRYNFKNLVNTGSKENCDALWEAFQSFAAWLRNGVYKNDRIEGSDLHAYILADMLKSPRFANAVINSILHDLPSSKFLGDLKERLRLVSTSCSTTSPLRLLYFDTVMFWKLDVDERGELKPESMLCKGLLGLDSIKDEVLIQEYLEHKKENCRCAKDVPRKDDAGSPKKSKVMKMKVNPARPRSCKYCQQAPWDRDALGKERYLQKV